MDSEEKSLSWFDNVELWVNRLVRFGEACIVILLSAIIILGICYETVWILLCDRQTRLVQSLKILNENWKVGLIVLIPLFYRPIQSFLERVEEFGGMKAPHRAKTPDPTKQQQQGE